VKQVNKVNSTKQNIWVSSNTLRTLNSKYHTHIVGDSVFMFKVCVCCLGVVHTPVQFTHHTFPCSCVHQSSHQNQNQNLLALSEDSVDVMSMSRRAGLSLVAWHP